MKKNKLYPLSILLILGCFWGQSLSAQTYCTAKSNAPWEDWISLAQIGTFTNVSGKARDDRYVVGYSDFTDKIATLTRGSQANALGIDAGANWSGYVANRFVRAWVDFNHDGDFTDAGEQVMEVNSTLAGATGFGGLLNVPTTAILGHTRLRFALKIGAYPTACETFDKGEVEDYTVNIQGPTGCSNVTSGGDIAGNEDRCVAPSNVAPGAGYFGNTILNLATPTGGTGGLEYIWVNNATAIPTTITDGTVITGETKDSLTNFGLSGAPSFINQTAYFRRFVRRVGCTAYLPSTNGVSKILHIQTSVQIVCPNDTTVTISTPATCFSGILQSARTVRSGCDIAINGLSEIRPTSCLPIGVSTITWRVNYVNLGFNECTYKVTVLNQSANLPDLTLANLNITNPSVPQGQDLFFKVDIKNIGTAIASGEVNVQTYVSMDNVLSANDIALGGIIVLDVAAGTTRPQVGGVLTPTNGIPVGQYYLILKVDGNERLVESNENNNLISIPFSITTPQTGGDYCVSKGTAPWQEWIADVQLSNINNTSQKEGYGNFTNLTATLAQGGLYSITITRGFSWAADPANANQKGMVWIDYNQNKTFEVSEIVATFTRNVNTQSFFVPAGAKLGTTRMRISFKTIGEPTPCETFDKGEVEDYTINIQGGNDPCLTDITPPVIANCPQSQTRTILQGECVTLLWTPPTATDNCSTATVRFRSKTGNTLRPESSPTQAVFNTCVSDSMFYTATDARGNTSVCAFAITLINGCQPRYATSRGTTTVNLTTTGTCASYRWEVLADFLPCGRPCQYQGWGRTSVTPNVTVTRVSNLCAQVVLDSACFPIGKTTLVYAGGNGQMDTLIVNVTQQTTTCPPQYYAVLAAFKEGTTIRYQTSTGDCANVIFDSATTANRFNIYQRTSNPLDGFDVVGRIDNTGGSSFYTLYLRNGTTTLPANFPNMACTTGAGRIYFQNVTGSLRTTSRGAVSGRMAEIQNGNFVIIQGAVGQTNSLLAGFTDINAGFGILATRSTPNCANCIGDVTPPTLSCPINTTVVLPTGQSQYCFIPAFPEATDNCSPYVALSSNAILTSTCLTLTPTQASTGMSFSGIAVDPNGNRATCVYSVNVTRAAATDGDIALSLTSTPSVISQPFSVSTLRLTAKNIGSQSFTNIKVTMPFGARIVTGGTATASTGVWSEWCAGGVQCFEWTIPNLAGGATATLDVPVYIGSLASPIFSITAGLKFSIPTDLNRANNEATLVINPTATNAPQALAQRQPTQLIPVVIQRIAPNPSDGEVSVELESLDTREVRFDFFDAFGKIVKTEVRKVEKGTNRVLFEVFDLPQGIYFFSPSTNKGKNMPTKFVKM